MPHDFKYPEWSFKLVNYYWVIRVERRNKSKRRKYYRWVQKEKLRLAELGIPETHIYALSRFLAGMNRTSCENLKKTLSEPQKQLRLF